MLVVFAGQRSVLTSPIASLEVDSRLAVHGAQPAEHIVWWVREHILSRLAVQFAEVSERLNA